MEHHVFPVWMVFLLDNGLRKLGQDPEKILKGLVAKGDMVADIGCGPGFFTLPLARMAGETGKVFACDVQDKMLEIIKKKIHDKPLFKNVLPVKLGAEQLKLPEGLDFVLCFNVIHEMENSGMFFEKIYGLMKNGGKMLVAEPNKRVNEDGFRNSIEKAILAGFKSSANLSISGERTALFLKP